MNTPETPAPRPLGFWLRALDASLSREIDGRLAAEGVTRRDWMLLNVIDGSVDAPWPSRPDRDLGRGRGPGRGRGRHLRYLADRGWVEEAGDGSLSLTDAGREAKQRLAGIIDEVRSRLVETVGEQDYETTVRSLEALTRSLGGADDDSFGFARGHFGRGHGSERGHGRGHGFGRGHGDGHGRGYRHGSGDGHGRGFRDDWGGNRHHGFGPRHPGYGPRPDRAPTA